MGESLVRNPRRKILTAAALIVGMAVATATLTVALEVGDRMAQEFRSLGANLLVTPRSDSLPLEIGGVDYRPVDEGAYLQEANLGRIKMIFWRHNILGFTPFLDVPVAVRDSAGGGLSGGPAVSATLIGTWYRHPVPVPDGTSFTTGSSLTHPYWKIRGSWFHDPADQQAGFVGRGFGVAASAASLSQAPGAPAAAIKSGARLLGSRSFGSDIRSRSTGGALAPEEEPYSEAVVGAAFAATFRGGITPGKTIYVTPVNGGEQMALGITGIVSTGDAEDRAILVPLSVAQTLSGHPGEFRQLFVSALTKPADELAERDPKSLTPTEYDRWFCSPYISSISYQISQVLPDTDIRAIRRVADSEGRILSHVSTLLWIVTGAALLAAALAVAATSATIVLQRRAEIGIMKAIGATNALVGGIFLVEQLLLALGGGSVGFIIGAFLARVLGASVFGTPAEPRLVLLPIVLGLAAVVSIAGSLVPLRHAVHLDPAPVLRGE